MRCKNCSQVRGYPYKRSHLVALLPRKYRRMILHRLCGRESGEESISMIGKPLLSALAALIVSSQASATDIRRIVTGVGC
jgi:hypothetical protein